MPKFALDTGPVLILAAIAAVLSFTHISDLAATKGQHGWKSWAVAICIDLTCVMAARERQRDKHTGRKTRGLISWPSLVLTGGIALTLAANLAQAQKGVWDYIVAGTPAAAFLIAVSMLERRTSVAETNKNIDHEAPVKPTVTIDRDLAPVATAAATKDLASRLLAEHPTPELASAPTNTPKPVSGLSPALLAFARQAADQHHARTGELITANQLRARLNVPEVLATALLEQINN